MVRLQKTYIKSQQLCQQPLLKTKLRAPEMVGQGQPRSKVLGRFVRAVVVDSCIGRDYSTIDNNNNHTIIGTNDRTDKQA